MNIGDHGLAGEYFANLQSYFAKTALDEYRVCKSHTQFKSSHKA